MNQAVKEFSDKLRELGEDDESISKEIKSLVTGEIFYRVKKARLTLSRDLEIMDADELVDILKGCEQ